MCKLSVTTIFSLLIIWLHCTSTISLNVTQNEIISVTLQQMKTENVNNQKLRKLHRGGFPRNRRAIAQHMDTGYVNGWTRYVEAVFVVDYTMSQQFENNIAALQERCKILINSVNSIMKPLDIFVVLVDVEIVTDRTLSMARCAEEMLNDYYDYRYNELIRQKNIKHDITIFLCGHDLPDDILGCSAVGYMCSEKKSASIIQHHPKTVSVAEVANVIAHEMGHVLGVKHDGPHCGCHSSDSCLMTKHKIKSSAWSNCSEIYYARNIDRFTCLLNVPELVHKLPSCGNGRLDHGEQCDCGANCIDDPCCDGSTCKLTPHSVCATGSCCNMETCKPFPPGTVCRKSTNECDLPEYCTGSVEFCPKDVYKLNGLSCHGNKGTCYNNKCGSRELWCEYLTAPSATEPSQKYLSKVEMNKALVYNECENLLCQPHLKIDFVSDSNNMFHNFDFTSPVGSPLVLYSNINTDGLSCSQNRTCLQKKCRVMPLPQTEPCASECSGHGVCNNEGHCHCDASYSPPNCSDPGFGGSYGSGYLQNPYDQPDIMKKTVWIILGFIPFLALLCCLWPNIKLIWDNSCKEKCSQRYPKLSNYIETICCPCMLFLSRWLCTLGYDLSKAKQTSQCEDDDLHQVRKTICQVDFDVKPPDAEVRTWGVASDVLFTDLITITPKGSPRTTKKIMLPSNSPILRRAKSEENLSHRNKKPEYKQSISKDSGNVIDVDYRHLLKEPKPEQKFKSSMTSLISVFSKFGQHKHNSEEDHTEKSAKKAPSSKPPNLRRMVVDPKFGCKFSGGSSPPMMTRPDLRRSFSTDPTNMNRVKESRPLLPLPTPLGQVSSSMVAPIHGSEQHLHYIMSVSDERATVVGDNTVSTRPSSEITAPPGKSFESVQQQHSPLKALLPPMKRLAPNQ